jgi:hypothetical protein
MHIVRLVLLDFETGGPASVIRRRRQYPPLSRSSQHPTSQSQVSSLMLRFFNLYYIFLLFKLLTLFLAGQVTKASQTEPTRRHNGGGGGIAGAAATAGESRRSFATSLEAMSGRRAPAATAGGHETAPPRRSASNHLEAIRRTNGSNLETARRIGGSIRSLEGKAKVRCTENTVEWSL